MEGEEVSTVLLDPHELDDLARLEQRLIDRFSPPLPPDQVRRAVLEATARFDTAVVRTYLPLLIERDAVTRLRAALEATALRPVGGGR
jgi:hypothetical protein